MQRGFYLVRLVTISLATNPIESFISGTSSFFVPPPLTVKYRSVMIGSAVLRRSPRRHGHNFSKNMSQDIILDAEETPVNKFQTPQKRQRTSIQGPADKKTSTFLQPISTPSTPDLCESTSPHPLKVPKNHYTEAIESGFRDLQVSPAEFRPSASLTTGQSFHWKALVASTPTAQSLQLEPDTPVSSPSSSSSSSSAWGAHDATDWIGTLRVTETGQSLVVHIKETAETTLYKILSAPRDMTDSSIESFLREYFQLDTGLNQLYTEWSQACPRLQQIAQCIPGVRILQQDPWETLLSFICSSNNNIPRITQILSTLRQEYGDPIVVQTAKTKDRLHYYTFPSLPTLRAKTSEAELRRLGWGYRAKYVMQTMETLQNLGGERYLASLRQETDPVLVQEALLQFAGVGRKVADCVALFSLGQQRAIPVDVHVWNIARRDYDPEQLLANVKSLTPSIYKQVGDIFRDRFGEYAGWAHSLLFVAELPSFRPILPETILREMQDFREVEQARKQGLKQTNKPKK